MLGQGISAARDGVLQVIKDVREIKHTHFMGKKGSSNSLVSPTELKKELKQV